MPADMILALFIMSVGISLAGASVHLYQWLFGQQAMLRYDGAHVFAMLGHLALSFVGGPYIMLQAGWRPQAQGGAVSMTTALVAALVAFGWSFITGLLAMGVVLAIAG